jgi:hypothetical protein
MCNKYKLTIKNMLLKELGMTLKAKGVEFDP